MSTFPKAARFQDNPSLLSPILKTPRREPRSVSKMGRYNPTNDDSMTNDVRATLREIDVNNYAISAEGNRIVGEVILDSKETVFGAGQADKDYSAWVYDPKVEGENKENSPLAVESAANRIGTEDVDEILQERVRLFEGLAENMRKELGVKARAQWR